MYVHFACVPGARKTQKKVPVSLGTGIIGGCELPCGMWVLGHKPRPSASATSAFYHWEPSPAAELVFKNLFFIQQACIWGDGGWHPKDLSSFNSRRRFYKEKWVGTKAVSLSGTEACSSGPALNDFPPSLSASRHHPLYLPPFCGRLHGQGSLCGYQLCILARTSGLGFNSDRCVYEVRHDMYILIPFSSMEYKYVCNTDYESSPTIRFWVIFTL